MKCHGNTVTWQQRLWPIANAHSHSGIVSAFQTATDTLIPPHPLHTLRAAVFKLQVEGVGPPGPPHHSDSHTHLYFVYLWGSLVWQEVKSGQCIYGAHVRTTDTDQILYRHMKMRDYHICCAPVLQHGLELPPTHLPYLPSMILHSFSKSFLETSDPFVLGVGRGSVGMSVVCKPHSWWFFSLFSLIPGHMLNRPWMRHWTPKVWRIKCSCLCTRIFPSWSVNYQLILIIILCFQWCGRQETVEETLFCLQSFEVCLCSLSWYDNNNMIIYDNNNNMNPPAQSSKPCLCRMQWFFPLVRVQTWIFCHCVVSFSLLFISLHITYILDSSVHRISFQWKAFSLVCLPQSLLESCPARLETFSPDMTLKKLLWHHHNVLLGNLSYS